MVVSDIPLLRDSGKATIANNYMPARAPKALALGPLGGLFYLFGQESTDEAARRVLELCGNNAGVPCMVVAVDNNFVVPVPTTMKVVGFFQAASATAIAPELRDDVARRLGNGSGWTAVAAGAGGQAGVMLKAGGEQAAIDGAMADCAKRIAPAGSSPSARSRSSRNSCRYYLREVARIRGRRAHRPRA